MEEWLRIGAYVGSMLTSMIAAGASAVYWVDKRSKRRRLEDYLKARKERSPHEAFSATPPHLGLRFAVGSQDTTVRLSFS